MAKLCKGGVRLRDQVDKRWPKRDKSSDGWIGDRAHQARKTSDHNPSKATGIVHAIDIDENLGKGKNRNGKSARRLTNELLEYAQSGLPGSNRLKYVVYENRIASGTYKRSFWTWRSGSWGHTAHIHVSFTSKADRDGTAWPLPILTRSPALKRKRRKALNKALKGN